MAEASGRLICNSSHQLHQYQVNKLISDITTGELTEKSAVFAALESDGSNLQQLNTLADSVKKLMENDV